ncbi:MAG TPA: PepSY domain-containing protein [Chitinophagales bacterium]|nr:PepSY domain-containing protein [Chitinophagales bacterium]
MTLTVWRSAHLALAVFSFVFLLVASVTGVILAIDAVDERMSPYEVENFDEITLAQSLPELKKVYSEIFEISVDHNQFVTLEGFDEEGNDVKSIIHPLTGQVLAQPEVKNEFVQWNLALHRSLFLKETGRFIIGIISFLLMLITISGTVLIIKRQQGVKHFFAKINKDSIAQYYHVVAGRLLLIPIFILALTGTYLFLLRFEIIPNPILAANEISTTADFDESETLPLEEFPILKETYLSEVLKIEFPIFEDPEEFYKIKLKDREIILHQFTGEALSQTKYTQASVFERWSLDLHTGRTNILWAILLGLASLNIIFFIISGFAITLKRRAVKIKNKFTAKNAEYILLVGSENGSTKRLANQIHQQILANGQKSFLTEMNQFAEFPKARHFIVFTSTYGLGCPPSNATKFIKRVRNHAPTQQVEFSVVGFGSKSYDDYCAFATRVDEFLAAQKWATRSVEMHTVNDQSPKEFTAWAKEWSEKNLIALATAPALYSQKLPKLKEFDVLQSAPTSEIDSTFQILLQPTNKEKFQSGDLLAIYPADDHRERFYSISKHGNAIQLIVKLYEEGLGSQYLYKLENHSRIKARIIRNSTFHFPKKASKVVMIANGTGIAPFLGMIRENRKKIATHLYCGFRYNNEASKKYQEFANEQIAQNHLTQFHIAFSKEEQSAYVMDLIKRDRDFFIEVLETGGILMICGSLMMQNDVESILDQIVFEKTGKSLDDYRLKGQIKSDCY